LRVFASKRTILILALILLIGSSSDAAKYSGEAFSLGVGGRGLALGGAVIAGPFDGTAAYWNPAGMNRLHGRYLTAMHAETFGSLLNHDFVAYTDANRSLPESSLINAFGFYIYYLGGGGIKITQLNEFERPFVVREESHGDWLFTAAVSGKIKSTIDFGLAAKIIYRDIGTESGIGLTVDAGAMYQIHEYVNLGLMVTDITTGFIRYSGNTELLDTAGNAVEHDANTESIYPTVKPALSWNTLTPTSPVEPWRAPTFVSRVSERPPSSGAVRFLWTATGVGNWATKRWCLVGLVLTSEDSPPGAGLISARSR